MGDERRGGDTADLFSPYPFNATWYYKIKISVSSSYDQCVFG